MRKAMVSFAGALLITTNALASQITIDFEELTGFAGGAPMSFDSKGFTFTSEFSGATAVLSASSAPSSLFLGFAPSANFAVLESSTGDSFSLETVDAGFNFGVPRDFSIEGYNSSGLQISQSFSSLGGFYSSITLGSGWDNLTSVRFVIDQSNNPEPFNILGLDNIVVSVIPLPAALWLFLSALSFPAVIRFCRSG